jgi:hypothetical protein
MTGLIRLDAGDDLCARRGDWQVAAGSVRAGTIGPQHISPDGDFKVQLLAHDVVDEQATDVKWQDGMRRAIARRSGFAWFNYAALAPAPVIGRVDVNTADARLLRALPGVNAALADAIANGLDRNGRARLKPHRAPGDPLDVRGMTQDRRERFVNMVSFDRGTFTVQIDVQALRDNNRAGAVSPDKGEQILAQKSTRYTIRLGHDEQSHRVQLLEQR